MKRFGGDKKYLYWGVTAFVVIACCIFLYYVVMHWAMFSAGLGGISRILSPFIWGVVIAYLLRPMCAFFQRVFLNFVGDKLFPKSSRRSFVFARSASIFLSEAAMLLIISALLRLILPQLYTSIESLVAKSSGYFDRIVEWGQKVLNDYPQLEAWFLDVVGETSSTVTDWLRTSLMPQMTSLLTNITNGVYYFVRGIYYVLVGVIASVYILFNRENVSTGAKKLLYSLFDLGKSEKILDSVRFMDRIFMGFVTGKLVDSAIIGVICYIVCLILNMPYVLLVSVIVGVTNIIPFFGPFIGAVPSAIIILMDSPIKCLVFVVFIFLLQQFDGNVLGPKILGETTGINGFWVMFSIIVGAGLFGFAGMLLGVPVFVIIYTAVKNLAERGLKNSGLPTETAAYEDLDHFDRESGEAVPLPPQPTARERRETRAAERMKSRRAMSEMAARWKKRANKDNKADDNGDKKEDD